MPWHEIPGDDGFLWSLRMARMVCAGLLLFPVLFLGAAALLDLVAVRRADQPVLAVTLLVVAMALLPAAPFVRERTARVGIDAHLARELAMRRPHAVYATFATATITGAMIAQVPALFGFVATALTGARAPLAVGSALSYAAWLLLWPQRALWSRWSLRAGLEADPARPEA